MERLGIAISPRRAQVSRPISKRPGMLGHDFSWRPAAAEAVTIAQVYGHIFKGIAIVAYTSIIPPRSLSLSLSLYIYICIDIDIHVYIYIYVYIYI